MSFFQIIKCKLNLHDWNEWQYCAANSCEQRRVCSGCEAIGTPRERHQWSEWQQVAEVPCEQQRSCSHCEAKERRDSHEWEVHIEREEEKETRLRGGSVVYQEGIETTEVRVITESECKKCGLRKTSETVDYYDMRF